MARKPAIDIFGRDQEAKRKANSVLDKMGMPSDYKEQYIAEKDMKGQSNKALKAKKQKNLRAIRDGGSIMNRTDRIMGMDKSGGHFETYVGKQYFGETKKKTKRPTAKKK